MRITSYMRSLCVLSALAFGSTPFGVTPALAADNGPPIIVGSTAELVAALSPENAGRRILVLAGTYAVSQPLTVPDGATLEGEGVMLFDEAGLPTGFAAGTETTLSMTSNAGGDVLTFGDGVTIRGLEIADLQGRTGGNVVAVVSRGAGDRVSATVADCVIVNPNPAGIELQGPTGSGLVAITRNLNMAADPPPHVGASITVRMVRSVIRSPSGGTGVFAFNFAANGRVSLTLASNVIGGGVLANGGVSRPDAVHDSQVRIESRRNLYQDDSADPCAPAHVGWNLTGGSGPPAPIVVPDTSRNTLRVHSVDDRIEGFARAILATGSRRFFPFPLAGWSTDNSIDLQLHGSTVSSAWCGELTADFELMGAWVADAALDPGSGNRVRVLMTGVTGSGPRSNVYANAASPSGALDPALESDNRLEIVGSSEEFGRTNHAIDPLPGAEHFTSRSR